MVVELHLIVPRCEDDNPDGRACRNCGHLCAPQQNTMVWLAWRDPDIQGWPMCEVCAEDHGLWMEEGAMDE